MVTDDSGDSGSARRRAASLERSGSCGERMYDRGCRSIAEKATTSSTDRDCIQGVSESTRDYIKRIAKVAEAMSVT